MNEIRILMLKANTVAEENYKHVIKVSKKNPTVFHTYSTVNQSMDISALYHIINEYKKKEADNAKPKEYAYPLNLNLAKDELAELVQLDFTHTSEEVRNHLYTEGFKINSCHFVRYKRSAGAARENKCYFIYEPLLHDMIGWSIAGLHMEGYNTETSGTEDAQAEMKKIKENNVSFDSYIALTLSNTVATVSIKPNQILLVPDVSSVFEDEVFAVDRDESQKNDDGSYTLKSSKSTEEIENVIWDGEGFLDAEAFTHSDETRGKGMMLLRNKFFKSCVFNTNLKKWMTEKNIKLGDLKDRNCLTLAESPEEIRLVITDSSLKYLKFCNDRERGFYQWLAHLDEDFGIVKTDHASPFFEGNMVKTSYQMLNTLELAKEEVEKLLDPAFDYRQKVRDDKDVLFYHMSQKASHSNKNDEDSEKKTSYRFEILRELLKMNEDFYSNILAKELRQDITGQILDDIHKGKFLIPGRYATIMGNGYEMLEFLNGNKNFKKKGGKYYISTPLALQMGEICNTAFSEGELFCMRYPHVTMGNIYLPKNVRAEEYSSWFNLTNEIVCINSINENIMQRLNGCDFDSDVMLLSNHEMLVASAKKNYGKFLVPYCKIKPATVNLSRDKADNRIGNNYVGQIINLSQTLNSIYWDKVHREGIHDDALYADICTLAVLSGMEIDKAKREYPVSTRNVLRNIRNKYKKTDEKTMKPKFLHKDGIDYETTMNYVFGADRKLTWKQANSDFKCLVYEGTRPNKQAYDNRDRMAELIQSITDEMRGKGNKNLKLKTKGSGVKKEDLGRLNESRRNLLESHKDEVSKLLKNKQAMALYLELLDKWAEEYKNRRKGNENTEDASLTRMWVLLYYLWNDEGTKGNLFQQLLIRSGKRNKLYITNEKTDLLLYGFFMKRKPILIPQSGITAVEDYEISDDENPFDDDDSLDAYEIGEDEEDPYDKYEDFEY